LVRSLLSILTAVVFAAALPALAAEGPTAGSAGVSICRHGMILYRDKPGAAWTVPEEKANLPADVLILGLPGAAVRSANGAVEVQLRADFDSPLPVLEPGIKLHANDKVDLDLTLDRGRIDLCNCKHRGPAHVLLHAWDKTWEVVLEKRGAHLAVELFGRWPPGSQFTLKPGPRDVPSADMLFLVLTRSVEVGYEGTHFAMKAPPGPAEIGWNNFAGMDPSPHRLDKAPAWANVRTDPEGVAELKKRLATRDRIADGFTKKPPEEVIDELIASKEPFDRRCGVVLAGAIDDLPHLGKILNEPGHQDLWDNTVMVLRHWLGRAPGQDQKLYAGLLKNGFKSVQAETVIEFLHGFSETDRERPETYQMLIDYLVCDRLAIRGLAYWHLRRLVPKADTIDYDPAAPMDELRKARAAFKKLLPPGKLPKDLASTAPKEN
jgi:hypothetical protein